jgi:type III secretion control protein HpaP
MTRPRQIAFRSLVVHRPDQASARPPAVPSGFGAKLQRCRQTRPQRAEVAPLDELPSPVAPRAIEAERHGHGQPAEDEAPSDDADGSDWTSALTPTADTLDRLLADAIPAVHDRDPPPALLASIAQTIAGFCNERAVDESEGWTVRMPLRPDVLEDTTLELTVSSYWLQLRFLTPSTSTHQLISRHQVALRSLLSGLLNRQRDIAIVID